MILSVQIASTFRSTKIVLQKTLDATIAREVQVKTTEVPQDT